MANSSALLKSSIAKKYWMAFTGLFLILFLVGHLLGNLQLLAPYGDEARDAFNLYALFMTTNPAIKIMSYITYISILFHAIDGIMLTIQNRKARPEKYAYNKPEANSKWASRNMALLGSILLVFIVLHMLAFWKRMHFGPIETYLLDGQEIKDLYSITIQAFQDPGSGLVVCIIYAVAMIALGFHLSHGFQAAFQSLGLRHAKHTVTIEKVGSLIAILIPTLFAIIPLYVHFVL